MIYTFPEPSSPIRQGDIFINVPILALPDDELPVIDNTDNPRAITWEEFAATGESVSALIAVRPTIAIVGTQECDAVRAPSITLFEVRPFRDIERKSKDTSKPAKWVPILTQHARINQKWFYLPSDDAIGFGEKMGADFLTPISIPRLALERLINFRKGRLNEVASQHFRERLADFFRRYAYDEWYPLTREELTEYQKNHPDAAPFPWQVENPDSGNVDKSEKNAPIEISADNEKAKQEHLAKIVGAFIELHPLIMSISRELESLVSKVDLNLNKLRSETEVNEEEYERITSMCAADMNMFSASMEKILLNFENNLQVLDKSVEIYVSLINPESSQAVEELLVFRKNLEAMPSAAFNRWKKSMMELRNKTLLIRKEYANVELQKATNRQAQVLDRISSIVEENVTYALRTIYLIDKKFRKPPDSEDKAD